uniref:histone-lysine N-methyltransferase SETD1A-like n=1 Tax=Oncorhynchus gorbuscha TaxID=8017 RepID=UPI001EAF1648|nr:histone-lysine N-methyltransferase SETD1A-like [Oncorhynchus gorbuscha]
MDPDSEPDTQRALSLQWKSYKLVQDPAIRRVNNKIYRYDGVHFSVPDSGFPPVGDLRDPRPRRIWSRHTEMALPVPKFKLDEFYVGPIPLKEVTFARLNDNIKEPFLAEMCAKFGEVEEMEILFHPKTRKHLGLARVLFTSTRGAKDTVKQLHNTSVMGNIIHAQLDIKGQQRQKYYDLIVSGSYTPQTVPTGGKALTERFQPPAPTQPDTSSDIRRRLSSEIAGLAAGLAAGVPALTPGSTTPCSVDTGFSEQRLDTTPSSMGGPYTPGSSASSQGGGTPYTPRSVSQDSGYAVARQVGYSAGPLTSGYPPQDMLPSSSCSSSTVSSSVGAYKAPRYSEDPHAPPQDPYQRCRPTYPPTGPFRPNEPPLYPTYPNAGGAGQHMAHHPAMPPPPPAPQYEQPPLADRDRERDRERDRDSGGRYGAGGTGSRRSSYQEANSSSKYSHHSHHSERERGYRRDSLGSREHGRHRNHHSHNHSSSSSSSSSSRRRSSHDRDSRERDRDSDYSNSSDPRFNSNSHRSSSNSLSPPPSAYPSYSSSKDQPPPHNPSVSSRLEPSSVYRAQPSGAGSGERGSVSDKDPPIPPHPSAAPSTTSPPPCLCDSGGCSRDAQYDHTSLHGTGPLREETAQPEPIDPRTRQGAQTPPYNGKSQSSPHSSGEDMEISDEDEHTITATDPSASPSDPTQHFGTSMPAPPIPSYPPHLPPPGFSLQPPPPPCIPPPLGHMELHPEYPPHMPPHMYDYASRCPPLMAPLPLATPPLQTTTTPCPLLHTPTTPTWTKKGVAMSRISTTCPPTCPTPTLAPLRCPTTTPSPLHTRAGPRMSYPNTTRTTPLRPMGQCLLWGERPSMGRRETPQMPLLTENPHEATVQLVLATLIQEMKSIMQRDLNRKMVENIAFGTFDEWWERKETKAKPFQTMVRGVAAVRDEDKKEENKASSKPREPLMSLVDWAKSGGMEGFSLRGALRLPSFKVKRKEPLELAEVGEMKRPKTPAEDDDEDSYHDKGLEGRMADGEGHRAERDSRRRKKKTRSRKPWDLDSEGEETSDGSSSDKDDEEEGSDKGSEDEALSADSDDESLSSSTESSSSSTSSSSSSSEDEEEGEQAGSGLDTMDESTMDSTTLDTEKGDEREKSAAAVPKAPLSAEIKAEIAASKKDSSTLSSNARPPAPRPSSPIVIVPPLKKRRKTVSFSTGESDYKPHLPTVPLSPPPSTASPLLSHMKSHLPDSIFITSTPGTTPSKTLSLLPFASKPGEGNALSPSPVLTVPLPVRPEDSKNSPVPLVSPPITPTKSPNKRGASPKSPAPVWVCRTVQNLPLDHASMVKMAFEEAPPPVTKGRGRGRPRTVSLSTPTPPPSFHTLREEEEEGLLTLGEQLGASSQLQQGSVPMVDLSVLADVALKLDPDAGDSEETETSDEAEEQKMEEEMLLSPKALPLVMDPHGLSALHEHNYSKAPFHLIHAQKRSVSKQEPGVLLPADFNHHAISGVLEAPEEVIGEPLPSRDGHQAEYLSGMGLLCEDGDMAKASVLTSLTPSAKRKGMAVRGSELEEMGKEKNKKRRRKDKENLVLQQTKKQKEHQTKKQKRKLEEVDLEEDVDVEQLEPGELSNTEDEEEWDDVRKSERLFLQDAGLTSSQRWPKPIPAPEPVTFDQRSEFEQMTILYDIWNSGLDMEDMTLLKTTYEKLLQDDHSTDWLNDTHWVHHTVTNIPNPRRKKKSADGQLREHVTGCARSEGYYAISRKEKDVYLDLELPEQALLEAADYDASGSNRLLSERRSEQRRLLSAIGIPAVMDSDLLKLNQLKFRKKKLRFGRSRIHEWGLFTMEPIAADEMVIEYVGQNIRQMVADNREKRYAQQGIGSSYLFRVDHDTIIDATKLGNLARFINHCCTPNCYAKVITIESQKKIVIYSKQAIGMNEEITYDYKFPLEENKIPCLCGTENCRGTLN